MKKIVLLMVVLVIISGSLFAGGTSQQQPQGAQTAPAAAAAPAKVEIRAGYWGDGKRIDLYDNIIKEFEKVFTNVSVIREPLPFDAYADKLAIQVAGGNAPDFLSMHPQFMADYLSRGILEPLDQYVSNGVVSFDGWDPNVVNYGKYNGKIYLAAMGVTINGTLIDITGFKKLNVTPPGFDWSWDEAKSIGLQVRQALDAQGRKNAWMMNDSSSQFNNFRFYVRQFGHDPYDAQGNITFQQADVERWYAMWKDFRDLGIVPDAATSAETMNTTLANGLFAQERQLIAIYMPANQYWMYGTAFPDRDIQIIRQAGSKGNIAVGEFPGMGLYGVYSKTTPDKKLAAAQLLNFWLNDPRSLVLYQLDQGVPGNTAVVNQYVLPLLDKYNTATVNFVNTVSKIATVTPNPPPGASEIEAAFRTNNEKVMFGASTPAAAAKDFCDQAQAIRARQQK